MISWKSWMFEVGQVVSGIYHDLSIIIPVMWNSPQQYQLWCSGARVDSTHRHSDDTDVAQSMAQGGDQCTSGSRSMEIASGDTS